MTILNQWLDFVQQSTTLTANLINSVADSVKQSGSGSSGGRKLSFQISAATDADSGSQNNQPVSAPGLTIGKVVMTTPLVSGNGDTLPNTGANRVLQKKNAGTDEVAVSFAKLAMNNATVGQTYVGTLLDSSSADVLATVTIEVTA